MSHRTRPLAGRLLIGSVVSAVTVSASLGEPAARTEFHGKGEGDGAAALGVPVRPDPPPVTWDIPIRRTPEVERWITFFSGPGHREFETWLDRMTAYEDLIRSELRRRGMPEDLVYIALIESGFEPLALSHKRASGMWQFMAGTAREQGLLVDRWVDERLDPIRSTTAAVDFLQSLERRFGSWYVAVAAYNAGPARVQRAIEHLAPDRAPSEDLFWEISDGLPRETRDHVPRLIAAAILGKEPSRFGFHPEPVKRISFETVFAPGETPLSEIASAAGVREKTLIELNPQLVRRMSPPGMLYPVRVPEGTAPTVLATLTPPADGVRYVSAAAE